MSGHSKWHKIKHQKETTDKKKSQTFGKFSREIAIAARHGKDPSQNPALRQAIERAKKANVPQSNIDRLLSGESVPMQAVTYEAFGPGSSALLISAETDNSNRTLTEIKVILRDNGGHLGEPGTVKWKFTPAHIISAEISDEKNDELELALIDAGAEDIIFENKTINIKTQPEKESAITEVLEKAGATEIESELIYTATQPPQLNEEDRKKLEALVEQLQNYPDTTEVHTDFPVS